MNETSLLDVLLFLVANHIAGKSEAEQQKLKAELEEAGIPLAKLMKIANWLKDLIESIELDEPASQTLRIFNEDECEKLDILTRGCILYLEQTGALNKNIREWVIEQAMSLDTEQVTIDELKNLLSIALFRQYGQHNLLKKDKSLIITNPQAVH